MKKLLYILMLFFVLPMSGLSQNDTIINKEKTSDSYWNKNQIDLDVHILGTDIVFKRNISKSIFTGLSVGLGLFGNFSSEGVIIDGVRFNGFLGLKQNKVDYYFGLKYAPGTFSVQYDDLFNVFGFQTGIFYKISKLEIGINLSYIQAQETDGGTSFGAVTTSLIGLKIPLKKW